jgi:hypothetical protein
MAGECAATTVLKVTFEGDIHRLVLQDQPTYDLIATTVSKMLCELLSEQFSVPGTILKYFDDEGDLCTLVPGTFEDFLQQHQQDCPGKRLILKLQVSRPLADPGEKAPAVTAEKCTVLGDADQHRWGTGGANGSVEVPGGWHHMGPFKLLMVIRMLREKAALTPAIAASLAVQWLPLLTQRMIRKVDKMNHMAKHGFSAAVRAFLEAVCEHAATTLGLEPFADQFKEVLATDSCKLDVGNKVVSLFQTVQALPFDVQINFMERLAESTLHLLDDVVPVWLPSWSPECLEHSGVTCDGCGANPIVGPRFKCETCPDYDLCGNCFPSLKEVHSVHTNEKHSFKCLLGFAGKGKGKAEGKGKAKGKGKGWKGCKGRLWSAMKGGAAGKGDTWVQAEEDSSFRGEGAGEDGWSWHMVHKKRARMCQTGLMEPCAGGCGFAKTWHSTHCCRSCEKSGATQHGPKCAQLLAKEE